MPATLPILRTGRDSPLATKPELPKGESARGQLWSDVVFEALLTLRNQLTSRNDAIAAAAANSILELERTRMRHDKCVAGSRYLSEAQEEFEAERRTPHPDDELFADDEYEHEEPEAAPPVAKPDPAAHFGPPPDRAGAKPGHIDEVQRHLAMTPAEATAFVDAKLRWWNMSASGIEPGGFVAMLRLMDEMPKEDGGAGINRLAGVS